MNKKEKQILRENVCAIIFNKDKKLLMCEHAWIDGAFQFPQGGVDKNENEEDAIKREIFEEVNMKNIKIVKKMDEKIKYILPYTLREKFLNDGQVQTYFLIYFYGNNNEIKFNNQEKPEFKNYEWVDYDVPPKRVIYFKKLAYLKALNYFKEEFEKIKIDEL